MTTARFEMRDGIGMLILTDGNHVVELTPQEASATFDLWQSHMRPIWDAARKATEAAAHEAMMTTYREHRRTVTIDGEDWTIQMHPDSPGIDLRAWPSADDENTYPVGAGKGYGMGKARKYAVKYRAYRRPNDSYTAEWGTARYATIEGAIRGAIRNRKMVADSTAASLRRAT